MNSITIYGHLGRDPELREYQAKGETKKMAKLTVAVNRRSGDETDWFSVVVFAGAEALEMWKKKGDEILVRGRMECSKYTDKNGNNREYWQVVAEEIDYLDKKNKAEQPKFEDTGEDIPF